MQACIVKGTQFLQHILCFFSYPQVKFKLMFYQKLLDAADMG